MKLIRVKPGFYSCAEKGAARAMVMRVPGRKDKPWFAKWRHFTGSNEGHFDTLAEARKAMGLS